MKPQLRLLFLFLLATTLQLPAFGFNPKSKFTGDNCGTGNNEGSNLKLPIGLPFQYTDGSASSGSTEYRDNSGTASSPIVYSFDLTEEIGPASLRQTHTALEQARAMNAACVLIRINSYSGAIDAAQSIREELLAYDRPIIIYVEDKAISVAALISMAADSLYMHQGANIGQVMTPSPQKNTHAKTAVAPVIAHASPVEETPFPKGRPCMLNDEAPALMNSSEAVRIHLANAEASNMQEVLTRAGLNHYTVVYYSPGFFEKMIDLCMRPAASLVLIFLLALAFRWQRTQPFPGPATFLLLIALALFTVPLFEGGLANAMEIVLLLVSAVLLFLPKLREHRHRLVRLLPLLSMVIALTLCQTGKWSFTEPLHWLQTLGMTGIVFGAGWLTLQLRMPRMRFRLPEKRGMTATS